MTNINTRLDLSAYGPKKTTQNNTPVPNPYYKKPEEVSPNSYSSIQKATKGGDSTGSSAMPIISGLLVSSAIAGGVIGTMASQGHIPSQQPDNPDMAAHTGTYGHHNDPYNDYTDWYGSGGGVDLFTPYPSSGW